VNTIDSIAVTGDDRRMATLTIRDLPDEVRDKLRIRAAENGRSMEAEVRAVIGAAVEQAPPQKKPTVRERVDRLQQAFAPYRAAEASVVDELIAERRVEAWKESLEALEEMTSGRAARARKHLDAFVAGRRSGT
jgi:hypothetical protein